MSVGALSQKKEIPAHVRFEIRTVEDKSATRAAGRYVAKDVDYVIITAPYSDGKENVHQKVSDWLVYLDREVESGRMPHEWEERYKAMYRKWKAGQEMPLDGTPIKGWGVIAPALQETLLRCGIHTVEELAQINDTGMRSVGMGAQDLKNKAVAWLAQLQDKGPLTQQMAALKRENESQKGKIETLIRQIEELRKMIPAPTPAPTPPDAVPTRAEISAEDVLATPTAEETGEI
jgi:hypothetical protein